MPSLQNFLHSIPSARAESCSVFNDDLPPSLPRASIREQLEGMRVVEKEAEKVVEVENPEVEVEKPVEVELEAEKIVETGAVDVHVTQPKSLEVVAHEPEKGKPIQEDPVITIPFSAASSAPVNVERSQAGDQGFFTHDEEDFPIRTEETPGDYYYRSYFEKRASDIHAPVWKLKQECSHDQTYHAYLEETASSTSTTHRIVHEWRSMHKEWAAFEVSKKEASEEKARVALFRAKLEADQAKFESDQKTEEWSPAGWKRKAEAEAALLSEERKSWREIYEKDNNEKMGLQNGINNLKAEIEKLKNEKAEAEAARVEARSHRESSEQREVQAELTSLLSDQEQIKAELESAKKDLQLERVEKDETSRRLVETEEKLENSETARVTTESLVEPLNDDMLWMKHRGIISVANYVLNSIDLDQTVAHLLVTARNDGYAQGSATHGVNTEAAHAAAKTEYNNLHPPVMDLVTAALQADDFVAQLKEVFPDEGDDDEDGLE
ncbi:hypothetical protein Hanom_Chr13g01203791 [Helianthus anomalus]